jgi:hypothetical protein
MHDRRPQALPRERVVPECLQVAHADTLRRERGGRLAGSHRTGEERRSPGVENARRVVDQVYTRLLGHAATDDDGSRWAERIEDGEGTVRDAVRGVALSREYISRLEQRGNPANAVATLYRDLFAREPDPEGGKWAIQIASSQGFAAVIEQFIGSSEYRHGPGDWHVPGGRVPFCR